MYFLQVNVHTILFSLCLILNGSIQPSTSIYTITKEKGIDDTHKNKTNTIVIKVNHTINSTENRSQLQDYHNNKKPSFVKLNMKQGLTMNQVINVYALTTVPNELCRNQSIQFSDDLRSFQPWALKMFDSSSKLQSGLLVGNLVEFGSFSQCINIYHNSNYGVIRGKHCSMKIYPDVKLLKKILSYKNITERRFKKVHVFVQNAALQWAVCVPDTCDADSILYHYEKMINTLTEGLDVNVSLTEADCVSVFDDKPLNRMELGIIGSFSTYFIIIVVATIVDLYSTPEEAKENKFVNIFSAYRNSKQIFARVKNQTDLDCVHGIRFLSTCYVVIGHRYLMMMFFPVINSLEIMDWILYYRSTIITGGTLCVDTFFMISGMLVSIGYYEQISKQKFSWVLFYIYRYLRITAPLAIVVLWYSTLIQHFGSGPLWYDMLTIVQRPCQEFWWATILHIQNYVHPFPLCMTQAWYLTCDMQYYIFSPIILVPLGKFPVVGYINFTLIYLLSVASNFYYAWINKYDGGVPVTNQLFSTKYFQHHYIAPHTRAATYIIGLGFGYSIFKTRGTSKLRINYPTAVICWISCILIMLASLVGCHTFHTEEHDFNRLEASIFLSCTRSAWTCGIVWIVWACINGYGGPINSILSSHVFRVFSRISYGIYLLHMVMQYLISASNKMPGYFSDFSAWYAAFGDLIIISVIGFLFTVLFESPLIRALSLIIKGGMTSRKINPAKQMRQTE